MRPDYDLIIFDWDGTLIDSIGWIVQSLRYAGLQCGLGVPDDAASRAVIGLDLGSALQNLFPHAEAAQLPALKQAYVEHYHTRDLNADDLFDGVPNLLDRLNQRGYQLAIATGKGRAGLDHVLNATGAGHWFCASRCSDETASKPNPRMLLELMAEIGVSPTRTLMVGDSVHDLEMAGHAGVTAVAVTCGANRRDELLPHAPWHCLTQTAHLLEFL